MNQLLLIIDDIDLDWVRFLSTNFPTTTDPAQPWTLAIVSALQMRDVAPEIWQRGAVVATKSLCESEGRDAFRLGALRYFAKDSRPGFVRGVLDGVAITENI